MPQRSSWPAALIALAIAAFLITFLIVPLAWPVASKPLETAIVRAVNVQVGDVVQRGQVMAALDPTFTEADVATARRALQTAERVVPALPVTHDPRLVEIDYGAAEGLTFEELSRQFPAVVRAWQTGHDAPFPGGECHADVLARLDAAIRDLLPLRGHSLVVTHNVVLRTLLGSRLDIPRRHWHRIAVGHVEPIETFVIGDRLVPSLTPARLGAIVDLGVGGR